VYGASAINGTKEESIMLRRIVAVGTLALVCAAPAAAAAPAHGSGTYRGTLPGGGHIAITVAGSVVTSIRVSGSWSCADGVVPSSYRYTARNRADQRPRINAAGAYKVSDLKFASPATADNDGPVEGSASLSGTFTGSTVSGHVAANGEASSGFECDGASAYKATLKR
jgi:hypothetical protein